ncbi:MAG: hypothetical protein EPN47_04020 [Acidobacteria bacterium]|nr:MAG: hypothetical protein EPN47_04020 [Acidobacteriota bacterium]
MFSDLLFRMRAVFRRGAMEAELDEELRAHLEHQVEKHISAGLSPEAAERLARFEFGDLDQVKEECRRSWGVQLAYELAAGVRCGLRGASRHPALATASALALALGILANTMMLGGLATVAQKVWPQPGTAQPALSAQNAVPRPARQMEVHPEAVARKVPAPAPARNKVRMMTAGFSPTPGALRIRPAMLISQYEEVSSNHLVLVRETWRQVRPGAFQETVVVIVIPGSATGAAARSVRENLETLQEEGWRPLILNTRTATSISTQWGGMAVMEQSGQYASFVESMPNL